MNFVSVKASCSAEEWKLREELAACYRLAGLHGWSDLVFTHISVRIPGTEDHFLINPYGMLFEEITASSLVRVDQAGHTVGESLYPVNPAGFTIHSCIHAARRDVGCIIHTHSRAGIAVSAQRCGILPISQQSSFVLPSLGYHDYEGVALHEDEKPRLVHDLADRTFLVLRNHGLLAVGANVPDAFMAMYTLENACRIQIDAQAGGPLVHYDASINHDVNLFKVGANSQINIAWPALLRKLDRMDSTYKS